MESESGSVGDRASRDEAGQMLRSVDAIRARAASAPRGNAVLQLAYSLMLSAYMALFVYTGSNEGGASVFGATTMALVLPPMIVSTGLVNGAAEGHGGRLRSTRKHSLAAGGSLALLGVILVCGVSGGVYGWRAGVVSAADTVGR